MWRYSKVIKYVVLIFYIIKIFLNLMWPTKKYDREPLVGTSDLVYVCTKY